MSTAARLGVLVLVFVICAPAGTGAQMFVTTGRDTLRGLPGVEVIVEEVLPELAATGLTAASIRDDAVRRLRAGGVTVYASQDDNRSAAQPYLYVLLNALELPAGAGFAAGLQVQLRQMLESPVTGSRIVNATTWDLHTVVVVTPEAVPALRAEIGEYLDRFVRDWQAVQP